MTPAFKMLARVALPPFNVTTSRERENLWMDQETGRTSLISRTMVEEVPLTGLSFLQAVVASHSVPENLHAVYVALERVEVVSAPEIRILEAWLEDCSQALTSSKNP